MKSDFKRTINWNKYQPKGLIETRNQYLDYLINPCFLGVNRLFVLSFENNAHWTSHKQYFLPTMEINDYDVMIDGKKLFHQPVRNNLRTYGNTWKIATSQGDDYTAGYLLEYPYFKEYYNIIGIDLSKEQTLDADPKAMQ